MNYYNEIDPFAAQWLRNLIKAGHITPGDVDERSIEDVRPNDIRGYTQCHFFAGIGAWSHALRNAGWPDDRPAWTGSCPCQPFSAAGKGKGVDDERHLWPAFHWLVSQCKPDIVFGEQVAEKAGETWLDIVSTDMEGEGYTFGAAVTAACGFGAPHQRKRLYWMAESSSERRGRGCEEFERPKISGHEIPENKTTRSGDACELANTFGRKSKSDERRECCEGNESRKGHSSSRKGDAARSSYKSTIKLADTISEHEFRHRPIKDKMEQRGKTIQCGNGEANSNDTNRCFKISESDEMLADTIDTRSQGRVRGGSDSEWEGINGHSRRDSATNNTCPTNGFWTDADWLGCRDDKWRPVEPGTFPLAHGATKRMGLLKPELEGMGFRSKDIGKNRIGRLKGYGNAIVAPQAQAFIEAFMECAQ